MSVICIQENVVDIERLKSEVSVIRREHGGEIQVCINNKGTDNDFTSGNGKSDNPQNFIHMNSRFQGTYISELISDFPEYFRWRIMCIKPKSTYSIHADHYHMEKFYNIRVHIPVITNENSYLVFFDNELGSQGKEMFEYYNLQAGNIYKANTSRLHTAFNFDENLERIHIVGETFTLKEEHHE